MKKKTLFSISLILCGFFLQASLIDVYKKGTIYFVPSNDFGVDQYGDCFFSDPDRYMTVAPDGSIFVSNTRECNIFKYNKYGKLIKEFMQRGDGPGDGLYPFKLCILDGKYLSVEEYAFNRKISIFDFSGKFIKVLKTKHAVFDHCAIGNNKIAYITIKETQSPDKNEMRVIIKDVNSGTEKLLLSVKLYNPRSKPLDDGTSIYTNIVKGLGSNVYLEKTKTGNLLVGVSNSPDIKIFSPDGTLIKSFRLTMEPVEVSGEYINHFKETVIKKMEEENSIKPSGDDRKLNAYKKYDFRNLFEKYFPYYNCIQVDAEGNILVFKNTGCREKCLPTFQVYSPEGKFICESKLDFKTAIGLVDLSQIKFTSQGIIGLFQSKDSVDISIQLMKMEL